MPETKPFPSVDLSVEKLAYHSRERLDDDMALGNPSFYEAKPQGRGGLRIGWSESRKRLS